MGYGTLLEKYNKRGKELKALRKINVQLQAELKQAKAEVHNVVKTTSCVVHPECFSWRQFEAVKMSQMQMILDMCKSNSFVHSLSNWSAF